MLSRRPGRGRVTGDLATGAGLDAALSEVDTVIHCATSLGGHDVTHARHLAEAAARGIYLRDRSSEPGCAGCIRITTGIVEHTRKGLAVLEEVLCVAR